MLSVGDIIRTNREAQHISQETLSHGICSTSNLSRIENGEQFPSRATYEALMQRMGLPPEVFPSFMNDRELDAFQLKNDISLRITAGKYAEAEGLIGKLEKVPKLDNVYWQFISFVKLIIAKRKGGSSAEFLDSMKASGDL